MDKILWPKVKKVSEVSGYYKDKCNIVFLSIVAFVYLLTAATVEVVCSCIQLL